MRVGGDVKSSKIAHRLHDPGFTTTKPDNGVCADGTSRCTQLVMANGYNEDVVLFDHCSRRESVDPFLYYTDDILACHERYLLQIRNNMLAPVEIVYGVPTWERTQNLLQGNLQHFDLWGTCKGITIYLEWENIRANSNRLRFIASVRENWQGVTVDPPPRADNWRLQKSCKSGVSFASPPTLT